MFFTVRRAVRISGVVSLCMRAFRFVVRFRIRIWVIGKVLGSENVSSESMFDMVKVFSGV